MGELGADCLALLKSGGLSVEQKLSGSHKALVEMQDVVAELLQTVPREYPASKVRGELGPMGVGCPLPPAPYMPPHFSRDFGRFLKIILFCILKVIQTLPMRKMERGPDAGTRESRICPP